MLCLCLDFLRKYRRGHIYDQNIISENFVVPLMSAYRGYRSGLLERLRGGFKKEKKSYWNLPLRTRTHSTTPLNLG